MKEFWDSRYSDAEYIYGEEPNEYVKQQLAKYPTGKALFPAEGEGRNCVYAATLGWDAYAFDISSEGQSKAFALAAKKQVTIHYDVCGVEETQYAPASFDAMILSYSHFPAALKAAFYQQLNSYMRSGAVVIMEVFSKNHTKYQQENENAGGPKDPGMLYDEAEIHSLFADYDVVELQELHIQLNEGSYHSAMSCVLRFTGVKR